MNDTAARIDWGWQPEYDLEKMTKDMLMNLKIHMLSAASSGE